MRNAMGLAAPEPRRLEGWHVLAMLVAFFSAIFAVNGYFLVSALSTYSGVVSVEPYRKGLAYNQRIAADEVQTALNWQVNVGAARSGEVTIDLTGSGGRAVEGLVISATLGRPSTGAFDKTLKFAEQSQGRYVSQGPTLEEGSWIITLEARKAAGDAEPVYRVRRRLWLKR